MEALVVVVLAALSVYFVKPAPPEEYVVLLPGPDGHTGAVVIERDGKRTVLDQPYAANLAVGTQEVPLSNIGNVTVENVRGEFNEVLVALPPRPERYLLYFVTGTDELTPESKADLQRVLEELRMRPVSDLVIIGHTDRVGNDDENDQLSLQRAERMRAELIEQGFPAARIRAAGRGEREPLVPTADGVEEPRNRRVEINVR